MGPGFVSVKVSISAWQLGQTMWVPWGPTGTTVVTIVGALGAEKSQSWKIKNCQKISDINKAPI